jgi:hypothetical protein
MLAENLLLGALGAVAALVVAVVGMPLAIRELPPIRVYPGFSLVPISIDVSINWRVFLFLLVMALVATLLFSASPAFAFSCSNLDSVLRAPARACGVGRR